MLETLMLLVLLVSGGLAIRYGLTMSAASLPLWDRLGGSLLAAVGVGALYFGVGILRGLF